MKWGARKDCKDLMKKHLPLCLFWQKENQCRGAKACCMETIKLTLGCLDLSSLQM